MLFGMMSAEKLHLGLFSNTTQCYGAETPSAAKILLTNVFAFHNHTALKLY